MSGIEFVDPPATQRGGRRNRSEMAEIADQLIAHPGQWAKVETGFPTRSKANGMGSNLRTRLYRSGANASTTATEEPDGTWTLYMKVHPS